MQNAPHHSQQIAGTGTSPFARAVSVLGSVIALAVACAMLAPAAHGQEAPRSRQDRAHQQHQQREMQREMQREDQREIQRQEMLRREQFAFEEQQRRVMQAQQEQQEGQRRQGRMTADERSELRRQINEANQDIYARPGRR